MAITANEFRLSNLIKFEGLTVKFEELIQDSISSNTELDERIQPIIITEEWLLNLGFEIVRKANYVTVDFTEYRKDKFMIDDSNNISFDDDLNNLFIGYELKYVHQLQNLYFALTGTELVLQERGKKV